MQLKTPTTTLQLGETFLSDGYDATNQTPSNSIFNPPMSLEFEDKEGNIFYIENAWVSSVNYELEDDPNIMVQNINIILNDPLKHNE
jgi:hypothetical protein